MDRVRVLVTVLCLLTAARNCATGPITTVTTTDKIGGDKVEKIDGYKGVVTVEVPFGETAILPCRSNDVDHIFQYWQDVDHNNTVVGPSNHDHDITRFAFQVLSGNLTIRAVSKREEGRYDCVSRGVRTNHINIRSVRMVVQAPVHDWEEVYEHDPSVNYFRVVIIIGTLALVAGACCFAYTIWKDRFRHPRYLVPYEDDEDSGDEIYRAPGTSSQSTSRGGNIVKNNTTRSGIGDSEVNLLESANQGISTDFKSILENANRK